jgi:putative copper export protein
MVVTAAPGVLRLDFSEGVQLGFTGVTLVALAFGMVALALMNRYAVVPRLRARGAAAIADLRRLTIAELGLAAGVLALVSLFGLLDPL